MRVEHIALYVNDLERAKVFFETYFDAMRGKRAAVIGIGVSNRPLIEILLSHGVFVTACDRKDRSALGEFADYLESKGCRLQLGEAYLEGLDLKQSALAGLAAGSIAMESSQTINPNMSEENLKARMGL